MMMRTMALAVALTVGSGVAHAHEGHDEAPPRKAADLSEGAAKARAGEEVKRLVAAKKADASWADAKIKSIEKKGAEWLVTFENPAAAKDKLLYVFLKGSGEFVAANHTGK